jgi:hypothetical protein
VTLLSQVHISFQMLRPFLAISVTHELPSSLLKKKLQYTSSDSMTLNYMLWGICNASQILFILFQVLHGSRRTLGHEKQNCVFPQYHFFRIYAVCLTTNFFIHKTRRVFKPISPTNGWSKFNTQFHCNVFCRSFKYQSINCSVPISVRTTL